jgi:uncharacterized protein YraI
VAHHRHKRDTNARRMPKAAHVAGPIAVLVTVPAVALGVMAADPATGDFMKSETSLSDASLSSQTSLSLKDLSRSSSVSRSGSRGTEEDSLLRGAEFVLAEQSAFNRRQAQAATRKAIAKADTKLWTTAPLNLWSDPSTKAEKIGEVKAGEKVLVTGRRALDRVEIVWNDNARWVTEGYLSDEEPIAGIGGACTNGTSAGGAGANIQAVHQAVCAAFPSISTYGTLRGGGGDHGLGRAVDIMVSGSMGWDVADFVRAHYAELGVSYVIYSQHIWSVERAGEGWRPMSDRGSTTANHYDHVHVSTF